MLRNNLTPVSEYSPATDQRGLDVLREPLLEAFVLSPDPLAVFDAQDRLVAYNDAFLSLHPFVETFGKCEVSFEDFIQKRVESNLLDLQETGLNEHLFSEMRKHHEAPEDPSVAVYQDGRSFLVREVRTSLNYSIFTLTDISRFRRKEAELTEAKVLAEKLARTDPLSGLRNRRGFFDFATNILSISRRYSLPMSLLLIDIDGFKAINDTFGHLNGDQAICHVADVINDVIRDSDVAARFGGDEFIILLPGTELENAVALAKRLLTKFRRRRARMPGGSVVVNVSVGVTALDEMDHDLDTLISRADQALFASKRDGGNGLKALRAPVTPAEA